MTWHICIFKLLWLAKSSETSVHDPYYCSTQNTDSQGYTCLKSSTEQQRFCVSSLSYQIRFSNYQLIDFTCLYMVGGCLQNITALLLGWGGVSRVREQIRKAFKNSSRLLIFQLTLMPALPLHQPVAWGPVSQGWTQRQGCSPCQRCAAGPYGSI